MNRLAAFVLPAITVRLKDLVRLRDFVVQGIIVLKAKRIQCLPLASALKEIIAKKEARLQQHAQLAPSILSEMQRTLATVLPVYLEVIV